MYFTVFLPLSTEGSIAQGFGDYDDACASADSQCTINTEHGKWVGPTQVISDMATNQDLANSTERGGYYCNLA
jgi:hypothetical protein